MHLQSFLWLDEEHVSAESIAETFSQSLPRLQPPRTQGTSRTTDFPGVQGIQENNSRLN